MEIRALGLNRDLEDGRVIGWLDEASYRRIRGQRRNIHFAPGQLEYNRMNAGFDLAGAEVLPLQVPDGQRVPP